MKKVYILLSFVLLLFISFSACTKQTDATDTTANATFNVIQDQIFSMSCAVTGCHATTSDASYTQHGLVLAKGQSYGNLMGKLARNAAAATLKVQLVKPNDADNSFLFHKITCQSAHHAANAGFGSQMPLGGGYLTNGQVELVRRWINAGAPEKGEVVNLSVLADSTACQPTIIPLDPPPAGAGFQMKIESFEVPKNFEREVFIRKNTPNTSTVYVNRIQMRGMSNSHHFVVYGFRNNQLLPPADALRDLRNANGSLNFITSAQMSNHIFIGGGTDVNSDVTLPPGVALRLDPSTPVDLNAHYFNRTVYTLKGENYVNFYTVPAANVQQVAQTLDLNNLDINIPAGQRKTFVKNFTFATTTRVVMLTSHFHKLGEKFVIKIYGGARNGEVVYTNTDWSIRW